MPYNFGSTSATPKPQPTPQSKPAGTFDFTSGAQRATAGGSFNFSTGKSSTKPKRGASSFLEKVSDVVDVPLAAAEAGVTDLWSAVRDPQHPLLTNLGYWATHSGTHSTQVLKDLSQGGAHQVAQNDVYFRQGSLQRVMADPSASSASKATANYFLHHPWAAGAADFAAEFANPSNLLGGPIGKGVGLGLKGLGFVAHQIPHLGPALDVAGDYGRALVNKYHPLHKVTPVAEQVARQSDAAAKTAISHNEALTEHIFGGANEAESTEIWRRAHGNPSKPVTGGKLTDGQLTARAGLYRASIDALDQEQLARHMADKSDLMSGYFPMRPKVAYDENAFNRTVADTAKGPRAGVTQPHLRYKAINTNEKVFRSPDEVLSANASMGGKLLAKGFHPANEFLAQLNKVSGNIALDNFVKQMVQEAPEAAHEVTAFGLKGREAMQQGLRVAARQASYEAVTRATKEIAQQFGMSEPEVRRIVARRFGAPAVVKGRIGEVQRGGRVVNRAAALAGFDATAKIAKDQGETFKATRFQTTSGEPEYSSGRGGTFYSVGGEHLGEDNPLTWINRGKLGGQNKIERDLTFKKPLAVEHSMVGIGALLHLRGEDFTKRLLAAFSDAHAGFTEDVYKILEKELGYSNGEAEHLINAADTDLAMFTQSVASRIARASGHDAIIGRANQSGARELFDIRKPNEKTGLPYTVAASVTSKISGDFLNRGKELAKKLTDPERAIAGEFNKLRDDFDRALQPKFKERALDAMTPQGYQRIKGVPGLSGLDRMQYTAFKPEVVKYLTDYGAPRAEAEGIAAFMDRLNSLYRIGIVTNPIVHAFYNLLWGYLGSGGNPVRLTRMFRGAPTALDHEAERYGAHAHFSSQTALGGDYGHMLMGPLKEAQGLTGKADWLISRATNANRKLVFDRLERNMATELWDDLAKKNIAKGMDEETAKRTAAMRVRKAFGDYDNISSAERNIRNAFFFYPWTKTVIPFWLKAGVERPQMVTAPMRALQTHNRLAGDPNIDTEKMGTIYLGNDASGQPVYKSVPLPQRYLEDVGELAIPRKGGEADVSAGIPERMAGVSGLIQGHMTPGIGVVSNVVEQLSNAEPQEPGVTPASHVMFNRDAPGGVPLQQALSSAAGQIVPFGGNIGNLAGALREALKGVPQAIPQALIGGFEYEQRTPLEQRSLNRFMTQFRRRYDHAYRLPAEKRAQVQAAAYTLFRKQVDALLNPSKVGAPASPAPTPTVFPQPQGSGLDSL